VVKGGKLMGFRCVAVVGDGKGRVGVGCQAGREVSTAVKRALVDAKKVRHKDKAMSQMVLT
jgi:small subunit ribosomal protein S5